MRRNHLPALGFMICSLFFISGATGLIYEVVWTRFFTIAYGNTTYGVSAVLTGFMAGLGLGSYAFGHYIDRKKDYLLIYVILEFCIAVFAFLMPSILTFLQGFYSAIYNQFPSSPWILQTFRTLLSFVILVIPTSFMGATLPVLSKFFVSRKTQVGTKVGILYGANTLGATIGCFLTGFFLIKKLGLLHSVYFAAALNLLLAVAFLVLRHRFAVINDPKEEDVIQSAPRADVEDVPQKKTLSPPQVRLLLICFGLAGFTSLAYEILWFRLLVFHLQTTIYAFTTMLTTFLAGIGLGSLIFAISQNKKYSATRSWENFGFIEAAIGLLGLLSILMFGRLEMLDTFIVEPFWKHIGIQFSAASLIMLLPTLLMGVSFPIVCKTLSEDIHNIGGSVGTIYAANTVGAIFGSFLTGFIFVRTLGTQNSIILISLINILIATIVLLSVPREGTAVVSPQGGSENGGKHETRTLPNLSVAGGLWVIVILGIMTIPKDFLFNYYNVREKLHNKQVEILHAEEGLESITTVHRYPDMTRVIATGSITVAGTSYTLRTTQLLQGHIPMLMRPNAADVLQVGFGSGETAHIITTYDNVEHFDLVEISQSVLDTSARFFRDINHDVVQHEKFHPIIMDGANYLRLTHRKYDVIMNDSIWPFYAGNSGLYTKDYFQAGKDHLKEGGIMTSWLPLQIDPEDFNILINTFHSVFPYVTVWVATTHYNKHALLVGSEKRIVIDLSTFQDRFDRYAREDLKTIDLDNPANLLATFKMDETGFAEAVRKSAIHTEDKPILEFSMSRLTKGKSTAIQLGVYEFIHDHMTNFLPYLSQQDDHAAFRKEVTAAIEASSHVMMGLIKHERFEADFANEYTQALQIWPEDPGAKRLLAEIQRPRSVNQEMLSSYSLEDLSLLGYEFLKNGDYNNAREVFQRMSEMKPDDAKIHNTLGKILFNLSRYEEAILSFQKSLSIEPDPERLQDLLKAHFEYAVFLDKQGELGLAAQHFQEIIRLQPNNSEVHRSYAVILEKQQKSQEAIAEFQEALRIDPDNMNAHMQIGVLLGRGGNIDASIKHLERAVAIQPENWMAHEHLAYAYYYRKEYEKAWEEVRIIQEADQDNLNPQFLSELESASHQSLGVQP